MKEDCTTEQLTYEEVRRALRYTYLCKRCKRYWMSNVLLYWNNYFGICPDCGSTKRKTRTAALPPDIWEWAQCIDTHGNYTTIKVWDDDDFAQWVKNVKETHGKRP